MVRFKNRHILVEFLQPDQLSPSFSSGVSLPPLNTVDEDNLDDEDEDDVLPIIPGIPFLLPLPSLDGSSTPLGMGDEGGQAVYKAIRGVVQEVYGDEGWGRIASSFKVIYHSPLTTLTIFRIARSHYRLVWSALTLLTSINNRQIIPRVVAISGTIKKLQNAAIVYHRNITARMLAVALDQKPSKVEKQEETEKLGGPWEKEIKQIENLQD